MSGIDIYFIVLLSLSGLYLQPMICQFESLSTEMVFSFKAKGKPKHAGESVWDQQLKTVFPNNWCLLLHRNIVTTNIRQYVERQTTDWAYAYMINWSLIFCQNSVVTRDSLIVRQKCVVLFALVMERVFLRASSNCCGGALYFAAAISLSCVCSNFYVYLH